MVVPSKGECRDSSLSYLGSVISCPVAAEIAARQVKDLLRTVAALLKLCFWWIFDYIFKESCSIKLFAKALNVISQVISVTGSRYQPRLIYQPKEHL